MARTCTVCTHPDRPAIDQMLLNSKPYRDIAGHTGLSRSALVRHKADHLPAHLAKSKQAKDLDSADALLEQLQALRTKAFVLMDKAEQAGELRTAIAGVKEVRATLELLLKLAGELRDAPTITIELTLAKVEVALIRALAPYPEARAAAAAALLELDTGHDRVL